MSKISNFITEEFNKTRDLIEHVIGSSSIIAEIEKIAMLCAQAISRGNKVIFAGNGGSAADSQHLAAELVSRLYFDRPAMPAIAITTDTSALTAIGNDYGYEYVFSRQLSAIGKEGDILIAISTSGNSKNILELLKIARQGGIHSVGLTGMTGGKMKELCDSMIQIPSTETAKIQECHISIGHIICSIIEEQIYGLTHNSKYEKIES